MPHFAENRETGERPVRSRHCMQRVVVDDATEETWEGRQTMWNCESGDLPAVVREIHIPDHEVWLYRQIDFDKPTAHAGWFCFFRIPFI